MKFTLLGLSLVAVAQGDSYCTYTESDCAGTELCSDVSAGMCATQYDIAQDDGCIGEPTSSCAAPNGCRTGGLFKYKCDAVNFTDTTYAIKQGVEAVFLQSWPLANCSGQPYPDSTTKIQTNKCVVTSETTSFMAMKEEWSEVVADVTQITPKYTRVEYTNRYCIAGAENPYGRRSNWVERFQNINTNDTLTYISLETIGGVSGKCHPDFDNTTRPDTNTGSIPPWTLSSATFVSLDQPSGLNVGAFLTDYDDGDVYSTTKTFTVANGSCYNNMMYTGCATSKSPMVVSVRTAGRFASVSDRWPYVPGCTGTEADHVYSVLGAGGCESATVIQAPDNQRQMYTECSTSGDQITWKVQAYSDQYCEHVNDYLNGLVNFENFPGAAGSSGAGLIRSTVAVVTAALLAAVLV